jgi:hypothetical protein
VNSNDLIKEIVSTYQKHGWQLRRVLLRNETRLEISNNSSVDADLVVASEIDAHWFARGSHQNREAWELRLIAENPFALFETFEVDETEEEREEMRTEMEARMREYTDKGH